MKNITVRIKTQNGKNVAVPFCVNAKVFASISNTEILSIETLENIKRLGYNVKILQEVLSLHHLD